MARSFSELGHDVTVLAMNTSKHFFNIQDIPVDIASKMKFIAVNIDTSISPYSALRNLLFSPWPYNAERFINEDFNIALQKLLVEEPFDIIQLEGLYLAPYVPLIRSLSKGLVSMRSHNIEHEIWQRTVAHSRFPKQWYLKILAKRIKKMETGFLNSYDVMVPITERDGEVLRTLGCLLPMHNTPTGIFTGDLDPKRAEIEYPSLFHIGALDWTPNQEGLHWFLEKVWPALHHEFPELKFFVAGRNAPPKISSLNVPGMVFLGEVEDAYAFMKSKAVMVVPLLSGSGMRIKIIEGMALGKTIVTTSIGTEGISTRHGHDLLVADTPENFTGEIRELIRNFDKFEQIGINAVEFVRNIYDNLVIVSSLIDFYKKHL